MKILLASLALAAPLLCALDAAQARPVRCTLSEYRSVAFDGTCDFQPDGRDGSFTLSSMRPNGSLTRDIVMVTVSVISPGVAEVRGLTRAGINSRGRRQAFAHGRRLLDRRGFPSCANEASSGCIETPVRCSAASLTLLLLHHDGIDDRRATGLVLGQRAFEGFPNRPAWRP